MKRFSEQFNTKSKSLKLSASEKRELRERVVSYMEYHPIPGAAQPVLTKRTLTLPGFNFLHIPTSPVFRVSAAMAVALFVIVPFMAEETVPGDTLYAIKVQFNEEVRSTFTLSPYKKIEWETERLNRRIAEARLLASEGRLTDEVEAEMAAAVKEHTDIVKQEIAELREDDADQATLASIELSTTLEMQSSTLQGDGQAVLALAAADAASENTAQLVVDALNESLATDGLQSAAATIPAFDKVMARVEMNTTRAYELLNSLGLAEGDQMRSGLNRRMEDVSRSINDASGRRGENETVASEQLVEVLQRTQKLIVFMTDIQNGSVGDLEAVVPVRLTNDELWQRAREITKEAGNEARLLDAVREQVTPGLRDKIDYAVTVVTQNEASIASSSDAVAALALAEQNQAMVQDLTKIAIAQGVVFPTLTPEQVPEVVEEVSATTTPEEEQVEVVEPALE
jgi:Domain of unknown function (DUF5667)